MSHWNYRVIREEHTFGGNETEEEYTIHSVYYDDDGSIRGWSETPAPVSGFTLEECADTFIMFGEAFSKPVIDVSTGEAREMT